MNILQLFLLENRYMLARNLRIMLSHSNARSFFSWMFFMVDGNPKNKPIITKR